MNIMAIINLSINDMPETATLLYSYFISSSKQLCRVATIIPILQTRKQIQGSEVICPESATLQVGELRCASDALALNFYTSLLHSPIFNVSVDRASLTRVTWMLFCSVQSQGTQITLTLNHTGESSPKVAIGQVSFWKIQSSCERSRRNRTSSCNYCCTVKSGWFWFHVAEIFWETEGASESNYRQHHPRCLPRHPESSWRQTRYASLFLPSASHSV